MRFVLRVQRSLGVVFVVVFLLTGVAMARGFPALYAEHEGVRMMYRATHIYILLASLLNIAASLSPAAATGRWTRRGELLARVLLMGTPPLLSVAFFLEPASYDLERPLTFWAIVACLAGVLGLLVSRYVGLARRAVWRRAHPRAHPTLRVATLADLPAMQQVRELAFAPVFASFRAMLGETIYDRAQRHEDEAQAELLPTLLDDPAWHLWVAELDHEVVGFVSLRLDEAHRVAEIGLNAVSPRFSGRGIGVRMYEHALDTARGAGMAVATVSTGGDPSHAPARRAYRRVGFDRETPGLWMCQEL